ncbi:MAG: sialate O-acetylesterase, partial [Bacteroidota bacterium]
VSAWGGTPAEVWIKKSLVENNPELNNNRYEEIYDWWPSDPGVLYNGMIAPVTPYGIAGTIWYQGESNCKTYPVYASLKKTLIENWREDFRKDFPFYFVQIAPFNYRETIQSERLREQQEIVAKTVPNTGMVVVSDLVDNIKDIHPKNKLDVGKRLAMLALSETYKEDVGACKSPTFKSMEINKNQIILSFNDVLTGLKCTGKSPDKFLIAGEDQQFVTASAKIKGSNIVVFSKSVKNPVAVRYCFDNTSMPDVFTSEGLPLAPFRTDRW